MKLALLGCLLLAAAVACGPKPEPVSPVLPDVPFEELNHDQKIQFMKEVVEPAMRPLFEGHDPEKFVSFGCKTCHGPDADRGHYHMPSDELPKLNLSDMSEFEQRDIHFMQTEVKPLMAKLLKETEYSPENPRGFGCLHCHQQVK